MADEAIYAFQDAIDLLVDFTGSNQGANTARDMRKAVLEAYDELASKKDWRHFVQPRRIATVAPETGTLSYSLSGNLFTIDSGTFPSWAAGASLVVGDVRYRIQTRNSSTTLTPTSDGAPVADIATGTSFTIMQDVVTLPANWKAMQAPRGEGGSAFWTSYVSPDRWFQISRSTTTTGQMVAWTIMADPINYGRQAIHFWPAPDDAKTIDYVGLFYPRSLRYSGYRSSERSGTISISGNTVTGTGTAFTADMVGSLLRVSEDGTNYPEGVGGTYPYQYQRIITAYSSATSATISGSSLSVSSRKYVVTDPLDIGRWMVNALWRGCERKIAYKKGSSAQAMAEQAYATALMDAMNDDEPNRSVRSCWDVPLGDVRQTWIQGGDA